MWADSCSSTCRRAGACRSSQQSAGSIIVGVRSPKEKGRPQRLETTNRARRRPATQGKESYKATSHAAGGSAPRKVQERRTRPSSSQAQEVIAPARYVVARR